MMQVPVPGIIAATVGQADYHRLGVALTWVAGGALEILQMVSFRIKVTFNSTRYWVILPFSMSTF